MSLRPPSLIKLKMILIMALMSMTIGLATRKLSKELMEAELLLIILEKVPGGVTNVVSSKH